MGRFFLFQKGLEIILTNFLAYIFQNMHFIICNVKISLFNFFCIFTKSIIYYLTAF